MKRFVGVLVVLLIVALLVGGMYVSRRNQMVALNETVKSDWAQVDVVLQRRADLIPNLVETVKGYAAQEQTVFGDIAKARAAFGFQPRRDLHHGQIPRAQVQAVAEHLPQRVRQVISAQRQPVPPPGRGQLPARRHHAIRQHGRGARPDLSGAARPGGETR